MWELLANFHPNKDVLGFYLVSVPDLPLNLNLPCSPSFAYMNIWRSRRKENIGNSWQGSGGIFQAPHLGKQWCVFGNSAPSTTSQGFHHHFEGCAALRFSWISCFPCVRRTVPGPNVLPSLFVFAPVTGEYCPFWQRHCVWRWFLIYLKVFSILVISFSEDCLSWPGIFIF